MEKTFSLKGINRSTPEQLSEDGGCMELTNMRYRYGAMRPMGPKMKHKDLPKGQFKRVFLHDIEQGLVEGEPNWIGWKTVADYAQITVDVTYARAVELGYIGSKDEYIDALIKFDGTKGDNVISCYMFQRSIGYTGLYYIWTSTMPKDVMPGLYLINQNDGSFIALEYFTAKNLKLVFLKRMMIVIYDNYMTTYLWNDEKYNAIASLPVPDVSLSSFETEWMYSEAGNSADVVIGNYFTKINDMNKLDGSLTGSVMYIAAYRLFDGSYILPSIPKYQEVTNRGNVSVVNHPVTQFTFNLGKIKISIKNQYSNLSDTIKDLVDCVCVFATRATTLHRIDEFSFSQEWYDSTAGVVDVQHQYKDVFPINDDFKDLLKSPSYYKIHEFPFSDLSDKQGDITEDVDTKDYYKNYATRETLPIDQYSHHSINSREAYIYNDRLHLYNVRTNFGLPYIQWHNPFEFLIYSETPGTLSVWIKTALGQVVVNAPVMIPCYIPHEPDLKLENSYYFLPPIVGYNDSRAYKIQLVVNANNGLLLDEKLEKNASMNFSVWHSPNFNVDPFDAESNYPFRHWKYTEQLIAGSIPTGQTTGFDTNRLQVSEIQNPLVFPAKYSYQVGSGDGIKLMSGSDPLSTGQFGQFPLIAFSSKGIWGLEVGVGEVLYPRIVPVNGEVVNDPENVIPIGSGSIVYTTDMGMYLLSGRDSQKISLPVEGQIELSLLDNPDFKGAIGHERFVHLEQAVSRVDFLTYIRQSSVGYDQLNRELIVSNPAYAYSYVFCFESKLWTKVSLSYSLLINAYPSLLGFTAQDCRNLSDEATVFCNDCLVVTRPMSLDGRDFYKKIERLLLRCECTTDPSHYTGLYLFASDDLDTWQLITGRQQTGIKFKDMVIQRSHGSAKHYIVVFAGNINQESMINYLDVDIDLRWNSKLR